MRVFLRGLSLLVAIHAQEHVVHDGGSCGNNAIPYQVSVSEEGPKLSCTTTLCIVGETNDGTPVPYRRGREQLTVECESYQDTVCTGDLQWTGGFMEVSNGTHTMLKTECCTYPRMGQSHLVKTVILGKDDKYQGGIIQASGHPKSFDFIKAVSKSVTGGSRVQYIVTVHRIPCTSNTDLMNTKRGLLKIFSRNKRRLNENQNKGGNYGHALRLVRNRRTYNDHPHLMIRRRRPAYRRRPMIRLYGEDYSDDYDYDFYTSRIIRQQPLKNHRLWPFDQMHADGGTYHPNAVIDSKDDPDVLVESDSNFIDYTELPDTRVEEVTRSSAGVVDGPIPPPSTSYKTHQSLPQYIPAFQEANYYLTKPLPSPTVQQYAYAAPTQRQAQIQPAPSATQYYYSYPSPAYQYNPSLNGMFEQMQCFSGDMEVETPSGAKAIKDVEVGDMVLTIDESMVTFSPVIMFLHKLDREQAVFLQIQTDRGESLKLTENHLMYVANCGRETPLRLMAAKEVQVGQCVLVTGKMAKLVRRRISSIAKVTETGIYAPLTTTGDIIVNHYLVSCHSNIALKTLQQTFFSAYRSLSTMLRYLFPSQSQTDAHLPVGVHYITTILDLFLPSSFL